MTEVKYYIDEEGNYLLGTDGEPPADAIEVPFPPDDARQKWNGSEWLPHIPGPISPHLNYGGLVRFTGPAPSAVLEGIRVIGVTRVSKGRYRAVHETAMPSDQYSATPSVLDSRPLIARIAARTVDYIEVRVTDLAGVAQDPTEVTIKTERVIYS